MDKDDPLVREACELLRSPSLDPKDVARAWDIYKTTHTDARDPAYKERAAAYILLMGVHRHGAKEHFSLELLISDVTLPAVHPSSHKPKAYEAALRDAAIYVGTAAV